MKKVMSLLLMVMLVLPLSACGGNETTIDNDTGVSTTQNQTDVTDTSSTEQSTETSSSITDNIGSSDSTDVPSSTISEPTTTTKPETSKPTTTTKPETSTPSTTTKPETPKPTTTTKPTEHKHSYGSWKIVKNATCIEEGTQERVCSCGEKDVKAIAKKTHNYNLGKCTICGALDSNIKYNTVPEGGLYVLEKTGEILNPGDNMPASTTEADEFFYGDYKYHYYPVDEGWHVFLNTDKNKTEYGEILTKINDKNVVSIYGLFKGCSNLVTSPKIPDTVDDMGEAFVNCYKLSRSPLIPTNVNNMNWTFKNCSSITIAPQLPNTLNGVYGMFYGCTSLENLPSIPKTVTSMNYTFYNCSNVIGIIEIKGNVTVCEKCFYGTKKAITITGECHETFKKQLASTANNGNVTY